MLKSAAEICKPNFYKSFMAPHTITPLYIIVKFTFSSHGLLNVNSWYDT